MDFGKVFELVLLFLFVLVWVFGNLYRAHQKGDKEEKPQMRPKRGQVGRSPFGVDRDDETAESFDFDEPVEPSAPRMTDLKQALQRVEAAAAVRKSYLDEQPEVVAERGDAGVYAQRKEFNETARKVRGMLQDRSSARVGFVMKEILGKPRGESGYDI